MKDGYARGEIAKLKDYVNRLDSEILALKIKGHETVMRYCPECKHNTIQKAERVWDFQYSGICLNTSIVEPDTQDTWWEYYCIVCGTKFKCTSKMVCEPIKEKNDRTEI